MASWQQNTVNALIWDTYNGPQHRKIDDKIGETGTNACVKTRSPVKQSLGYRHHGFKSRPIRPGVLGTMNCSGLGRVLRARFEAKALHFS
jgi:hypothetical protein